MSEAHLKSFEMPFDSMEPTILSGSDVVAHETYYRSHRPERWDVVVFGVAGSDGHFIKRVVGLPGEKISFTDHGVHIDGSAVTPPGHLEHSYRSAKHVRHDYKVREVDIPHDSVFVMGDNPDVYVADSREHGPVPISKLEAKVFAAVHLTLL